MELSTNIVQLIMFLRWDLLDEIIKHIVEVCVEIVCYSLRDLNEIKIPIKLRSTRNFASNIKRI